MLDSLQKQLEQSRARARKHFEAALAHKASGDWARAAQLVELALAFDPREKQYHEELAEILPRANTDRAADVRRKAELLLHGDRAGAAELLEEAAQLCPTDAELAHKLSNLLFEIGSDLGEGRALRRARRRARRGRSALPQVAGRDLPPARDSRRRRASTCSAPGSSIRWTRRSDWRCRHCDVSGSHEGKTMSRVIGIDLGTTNSCVAILEEGQPVVIPNTGGYKTTPSIFAVTEEGKRLVGHLAKRQAVTNAKNTVYAAKRLIGRSFDSPEVASFKALLPYELAEGPNNDVRVRVAGRVYTIPEISGIVLREMKRVAEEYLGDTVQQAVITVPAYFNDAQRQTTRDAGRIAGLELLRIINEPTAAALAYGFGRDKTEIGRGLRSRRRHVRRLDPADGQGRDRGARDQRRHAARRRGLRPPHRAVPARDRSRRRRASTSRGDTMALQRLKDAAEKAKCDLSQVASTEINLPFIAADAEENALHMSVVLTREKLEELTGELVERTRGIVQRAFDDAKITAAQLDQVLLVGGQTRMPLVQRFVAQLFGKTPHKGVNPDEVVAVGAAIQAAMLSEEKEGPLLVDVTPLSLGIATFGGHFARLIDRNTTVPTSRQEIFTTTRDNQTAVKIRVLQGESERADDNDLLGEFVLAGIPPGPKGGPEIEVTFDIDANGIVSVSARDLATGRAQSIQVNPRGTLSPEEIERLARQYDQGNEVAVKG